MIGQVPVHRSPSVVVISLHLPVSHHPLQSSVRNHQCNMTAVQGSNLLDVLKKKMRQTKEEMEKYKEESEDMARKLQVEICRREEVSVTF